jgi:hypothetical protein
MSIQINTLGITSGLVLSVDAGNKKSYPGTGSTWYDLSGNNNHGTGSPAIPTYNSTDGGGCFDLTVNAGKNGGTATVGFVWPEPIPSTGSFSFSCWVKSMGGVVGQGLLFSNTASAPGYRFGVGTDGMYFLSGPTYNEGQLGWLTTFNNAQWNHIAFVFDRSGTLANGSPYYYGYLNGVLQGSGPMGGVQFSWAGQVNVPRTSAWPGMSFVSFSGKLAKFDAYAKPLSSSDVTTIFNANRGRFGI